jgi:uncharacterized membrane protein (DUF373 family)
MNENFKYCIDHPWQFILIAGGCCLLLDALRSHIREILRFVVTLARLLLKELKPTKNKTMPELINLIIIVGLFILALLDGFPSIMNHIFGGEIKEKATHIFTSAIFYFIIVSIGSPTWLYLIEREKRIRKLIDDAIDK